MTNAGIREESNGLKKFRRIFTTLTVYIKYYSAPRIILPRMLHAQFVLIDP